MNENNNLIPKIRFKGFTDDWEQRKLEEIIDLGSGKDYKHLNHGNIPVYGTGGYMLSVDKALSYTKDAIGIGRKGTIDKPYILKAPFWTVDTLFYAICKDSNDINFVYSLFQKINWKEKDESTGVPSLSKVTINNVTANVTNFEEQNKIGKIFSNIDNLITLHQRKLVKLQNIKSSLLEKMFPKNSSNIPEIRFKGFTDDWEQRKLEEISNRFDNLRIPVAANVREKGTIPYYGANGIQDHVKGYTHNGEFVLIAEDGANDLKNYPVKYVNGLFWANNHVHVIQGKKEICDNKYLKYCFSKTNIEALLVGGGRAKLNANIMMGIELKLCQFDEQFKIGELFNNIDNLITLHQRKLVKLQNIKKCLLEKMFV